LILRAVASADAIPGLRHRVLRHLREQGCFGEELEFAAGLIVTEAASNVVQHAYPKRANGIVSVTTERLGDHVTITVDDDGVGMDPPTANPGLGVGLSLMRESADALLVTSDEKGTRIEAALAVAADTSHLGELTDERLQVIVDQLDLALQHAESPVIGEAFYRRAARARDEQRRRTDVPADPGT
jgi:anti-sigma regulatory factor (Ser/Thr protein kinase)